MAQLKVISNARPNKNKAGGSRSREDSLRYGFGENNNRTVAVSSIGCTGTTWQQFVSAFEATCAAHGKKPKNELYHLEQSYGVEFDPTNPDHIELANRLGHLRPRRCGRVDRSWSSPRSTARAGSCTTTSSLTARIPSLG